MSRASTTPIPGGCLCGRIRFEVRGPFGPVANCHCSMCRKAQGSAFATNATVPRSQFRFLQGEELLAEYESSPGKLRCFCRNCGSPVYSRRIDDPASVRPRFGTFDADPGARPAFHYAVESKAPWMELNDALPRLDLTGKRVTQPPVRFPIEPVGFVRRSRQGLDDDGWGGTECVIELTEGFDAESLLGLDAFSHVEVIYVFDRVEEHEIERRARHPRGNTEWPRVGIFAQRGKGRPNRLGASVVPVRRVEGTRLVVGELDAVEGTPVVDLKPVMREFLPRGDVHQPEWATALMQDYWSERR